MCTGTHRARRQAGGGANNAASADDNLVQRENTAILGADLCWRQPRAPLHQMWSSPESADHLNVWRLPEMKNMCWALSIAQRDACMMCCRVGRLSSRTSMTQSSPISTRSHSDSHMVPMQQRLPILAPIAR